MTSDMAGSTANIAVQAGEAVAVPRLRRRSRVEAWLFVTPALLFQLIWGWYPLLMGLISSFTDAQPILPSKFVGLANYLAVWHDPLMMKAFRVTFTYAILSTVLTFIIPIIIAIFIMEMPPRWIRWMMLLWFLPLSGISGALLWRYAYDPTVGPFEYFLTQILHLPHQDLLQDPNLVLIWLIVPGILLFGPGLVYMATLQGIPISYYEAAEVEGAGFWRKVWTISLPRLRPMISMSLTFAIIGSLQAFDWPRIMTNGDPEGLSRTVVMYIYENISYQRYAQATAIAVFLFVVILVLTMIFRYVFKEDPDV